jgi:hypothetical protein
VSALPEVETSWPSHRREKDLFWKIAKVEDWDVGVIVAISYLIKIALPVKGWKECSYRRQQSRFKL